MCVLYVWWLICWCVYLVWSFDVVFVFGNFGVCMLVGNCRCVIWFGNVGVVICVW